MELFACGLNAHQQLSSYSINQDRSSQILYNIKKVATGADINIYCTLWCATIIEIDKQLVFRGYHLSGLTECLIVWPSSQRSHGLNSVFGNLSGVVGALAIDGELLELVRNDERPDEMLFRRRSLSWLQQDGNVIDRVSIAGNGVTAVVTHNHSLPSSAPNSSQPSPLIITVLSSLEDLFSSTPPPLSVSRFYVDALPTLLSTPTSHLLLGSSLVSTFGSPLHPHLLARNPSAETPATSPHVIPFFGGIPIRKICAGGWICAAISQDNDLYVWGCEPGASGEERITCLPDRGAEEEEMVKLVDIEGMDVLDVGVGDGHIIALTANGEVWVCGRGEEGQLGLGRESRFETGWKKVEPSWGKGMPVGVEAGGWGSWVLVKKAEEEPSG